jgi:hypothetical protein
LGTAAGTTAQTEGEEDRAKPESWRLMHLRVAQASGGWIVRKLMQPRAVTTEVVALEQRRGCHPTLHSQDIPYPQSVPLLPTTYKRACPIGEESKMDMQDLGEGSEFESQPLAGTFGRKEWIQRDSHSSFRYKGES